MINLSNLKAGQTKTVEGVTVTKAERQYQVTMADYPGETALLWHDKDTKAWYLSVVTPNQETYKFEGETAKTVLAAAIIRWNVALAEFEAHQATEAGRPEGPVNEVEDADEDEVVTPSKELALVGDVEDEVLEGELVDTAEDEEGDDTTLDYDVNTTGGHVKHRLAAFATIADAMGGAINFSQEKGHGYHGSTTLHVLAPRSVINEIEAMLKAVEAAMEPLGDAVSKAVSREARATGKHHSSQGCFARRGFMRGFADGVVAVLGYEGTPAGDTILKPQHYDEGARRAGYELGVAWMGQDVAAEEEPAGEANAA